jgi:cation:H+ antiporter
MDFLLAITGLGLLIAGGDLLVRGAGGVSLRLGIPPFVVGLTVVALCTTSPEMVVSIGAALAGVPGIAVGNVVGSNIANVLLVLGLPALVFATDLSAGSAQRSYGQTAAATGLMIVLCFFGPLRIWHGIVLLGLLVLLVADLFVQARKGRLEINDEVAELRGDLPVMRLLALIGAALIALPLGAQLTIDGAVGLAGRFRVPEAVIGLTVIAFGTSLPELATTLTAAARGRADVALGNVIGACILNILLVGGIISLFGPVPIAPDILVRDLWVMLAATIALAPAVLFGWRIRRAGGLVFVFAYGGYVCSVFI